MSTLNRSSTGSNGVESSLNPVKYILLIIITTLIMGTSFPVGKIGMGYAPPFLLMGLRYILAGSVMALVLRKRPLPRRWQEWVKIILIGLFQSAGVMGCVYYSMNWISSSESAIITFTNPLLVIVFSAMLYGITYRFSQWIGVIVGFAGILFTFGWHISLTPGTWIGLCGAISFAISTLLIKRWGKHFDTFVLTSYQMLAGGLLLLLLSLWVEEPHFTVTTVSVLSLFYLTLICSIVQFSLWFYLLQNSDPAQTSSFLFLAPFFGVLSSWVMLGEQIQWFVGAGGMLIGLGIYLVNRLSPSSL
ncbi:EamA family transporter [Paenibacillus barcinonensis]|uniref:EamA family transporter n=1 Tax=Paenibacillus barcinonensis TaxID=198119 RepID=A0A2V4VJU2_PAEBA|nr:EamA family transporter [Paenibacillus barcinonensis]PYE49534.1 threonine/homoserine efflux transporter RhtA [Paenibacillus barcinonensis]QKS56739.1 EamA family transporter [Paenibacillus barcinonensis]